MDPIEMKLEANGRGAFVIDTDGERLAEMAFAIAGEKMTVFHTEVSDKLQGKGVAARLLGRMVGYAREHDKKVIPLCAYVRVQFQRHQDQYKDVWSQDWHP